LLSHRCAGGFQCWFRMNGLWQTGKGDTR
jgi:hypothetical protein